LELWLELIDLALLLQIEDNDAAGSSCAEPVSVGGENKSVDFITSVKRVQVLRLVQIPEHGGSVLSSGGAEGSIWGDSDGVDVAAVADVVGLKAARAELPDLHELVPSTADNNGVLGVRAESHARNPVLVSLLGDGELAVTEGVPELDCAVARSRNDLSVVGRERDRENIVGMSDKSAGGGASGELPEAEGLVP